VTVRAVALGRAFALALMLASCVAELWPSGTDPVDLANPASVLNAYLQAFLAGDCPTARRFAAPTFTPSNGELCGAVVVTAIRVHPNGPAGTGGELVYSTTLTTNGSRDGSIDPGDTIWFYDLQRQGDGRWLLTGGGSGP
jgi:hypothetical protein